MGNSRRSNLMKYGTAFPNRDLGRRENFGAGAMHQAGDDGPVENAIDKTGGDSTDWTGWQPQGFTDYDHDSDGDSNYIKNRYGG